MSAGFTNGQPTNDLATDDRLGAVDALRGFALAGIVVAHMIEQFIGAPRPTQGWLVESNVIDKIISTLSFLVVSGKFFSIFAVLFGMSFAIMMGNAAKKGSNFSGRFLWRLAILFIFGVLHTLLYRGDILTVYVVIGLLLPLFYNVPNKWLWAISTILFLGLGRFLFFISTGSSTFLGYELSPESPVVIDYVATLKNGSLLEIMRENFANGFYTKFDFQFAFAGRGYMTLAYFLVGMWLIRNGIMHRLADNKGAMKKVLLWSLGLAVMCYLLLFASASQMAQPMNLATWPAVLVFTFYDLGNVALTALLICGFLLLYLRRPAGMLGCLAPYGRMALTNYLLQTVVGTFIFYGWGLGLLGELHDWQTLLLAVIVIVVQVRLSIWWLSLFNYGPAEWLWRCATYFKPVPLIAPKISKDELTPS